MSGPTRPAVDVVIAVHDPTRPLERAVSSVLDSPLNQAGGTRVTVVCHNIGSPEIAAALSDRSRAAVRMLELNDGIRSAAGPFNLGIDAAEGEWVTIMGSDDFHEPGAIAAWLAMGEQHDLAAVIAPERHASGALVRTPPVRPFRGGRNLDPVKDRLAYRTAPIGLLRRETIDRRKIRLTPGLATGEDQGFTARLWFSGERIGFARSAPRYVVGDDARERTTLAPRPLADELQFIERLIDSSWFEERPLAERRALAVKLVRVHVFSAVSRWSESDAWTPEDRAFAQRLLQAIAERAVGFDRPLSIADHRLLHALADPAVPLSTVAALARRRRAFGRPGTLLTPDVRGLLAVEGPVRFMAASALL